MGDLGRDDGKGARAGAGALDADGDLHLALEHDEHLLGAVGVRAEPGAVGELEVDRGGTARTGSAMDWPRGADDVGLVVAVVGGKQLGVLGLCHMHV